MPPYVVLEKLVGETPLDCLTRWRTANHEYQNVPLAYAGRLDPMASGKLLVLVGEECKKQTDYHAFDKEYLVTALIGISSDSGDVLGIVAADKRGDLSSVDWSQHAATLTGTITLPYPAYSSRPVAGVPLHTWAVQGKLDQITIPTRTSTIHTLDVTRAFTIGRAELVETALSRINSLPPVTDPRKALGNDFRRPEVRASWHTIQITDLPTDQFTLVEFLCTCSSGTYMRTLCDELAKRAGTRGLAFSIHRTKIGVFENGAWTRLFT